MTIESVVIVLASIVIVQALTSWELCRRRRVDKRNIRRLLSGLGALGVMGDGFCFCSDHRGPDKEVHQHECRDARALLAEFEVTVLGPFRATT